MCTQVHEGLTLSCAVDVPLVTNMFPLKQGEMYDLVLKEGMWHEIAFSEGKRRRSFLQVAV